MVVLGYLPPQSGAHGGSPWLNAVLTARALRAWSLRVLDLWREQGFGLVISWGVWELNRSMMTPFLRPGRRVVDELRQHRQRERGPRIVTLGGGHGLATLLRGLKTILHNITASCHGGR
jgi:hypothetical protein